jgi:hypothetical protein
VVAPPRIPLSNLHRVDEDAEEDDYGEEVKMRGSEKEHLKIVHVDFDDDDEHDGSTLVGDTTHVKEKEIDFEVSDYESDGGDIASIVDGATPGGGIRRKRTIRVVIRSRAFL